MFLGTAAQALAAGMATMQAAASGAPLLKPTAPAGQLNHQGASTVRSQPRSPQLQIAGRPALVQSPLGSTLPLPASGTCPRQLSGERAAETAALMQHRRACLERRNTADGQQRPASAADHAAQPSQRNTRSRQSRGPGSLAPTPQHYQRISIVPWIVRHEGIRGVAIPGKG